MKKIYTSQCWKTSLLVSRPNINVKQNQIQIKYYCIRWIRRRRQAADFFSWRQELIAKK